MELLVILTVAPAYLVARYFLGNDYGSKEPKIAINVAVGFGVMAILIAVLVSMAFNLIIDGDVLASVTTSPDDRSLPLLVDVLIFAVIEEPAKFVPMAIFIIRKGYFDELTDGITYFAIVGLSFGAVESMLYSFGSGDAGVGVAVARLALGLFFHAALTSYVGFYFARAKVRGEPLVMVTIALIVASAMHVAYNFFVFTSVNRPIFIFASTAVSVVATVSMFWLYYFAVKEDFKIGLATHAESADTR